jgi:hypothetical protein
MNLIVTSTPFFLKIPAFSASDSGANPVHPLIATVTFGSSCPVASVTAASDTSDATSPVSARIGILVSRDSTQSPIDPTDRYSPTLRGARAGAPDRPA